VYSIVMIWAKKELLKHEWYIVYFGRRSVCLWEDASSSSKLNYERHRGGSNETRLDPERYPGAPLGTNIRASGQGGETIGLSVVK